MNNAATNADSLENHLLKCQWCGFEKFVLLDSEKIKQWSKGGLVHNLFPEMSLDDREMMISKTCSPCFDMLLRG
jgi:hypothetical protein